MSWRLKIFGIQVGSSSNEKEEEAAKRLGVPRSRVSELVNGKISKFTIDKLVNMAARVGLTAKLTVSQDRKRRAA